MHKQIIHELKMRGISEQKLSSYLIDQRPKIGNCASVLSKAFLKRDVPLSFIDFRILSIITEIFKSLQGNSMMPHFDHTNEVCSS